MFGFPDLDAARKIDGIDVAADAAATVPRNSRRDQRLDFDPFTDCECISAPVNCKESEKWVMVQLEAFLDHEAGRLVNPQAGMPALRS